MDDKLPTNDEIQQDVRDQIVKNLRMFRNRLIVRLLICPDCPVSRYGRNRENKGKRPKS